MRLVKDLDGTGRAPNDTQKLMIDWLQESWLNASVMGVGAPVASGKSFIARAIQRSVPGTVIITPHNQLINQYRETYPELNSCVGREHYDESVLRDVAFARYQTGMHSVFNLASYWYGVARIRKSRRPKVIVLDEADACIAMLRHFSSREIGLSKPEAAKVYDGKMSLIELLRARYVSAEAAWLRRPTKRTEVTYKAARHWYEDVRGSEQNYSTRLTLGAVRSRLSIDSLVITPEVHRRFFGDAKVVLLSATLAPQDLIALTGCTGVFKAFPSPIDVVRRKVFMGNQLDTAPKFDVDITANVHTWIEHMRPLGNGIVHCTYSDSLKWSKPGLLAHCQGNKASVLAKFIHAGGVLLGCGMATGVNLPGDLCRWNLIPRLQFPNISDEFVQKRRALADGQTWYDFEALRHVMQATGRSTRHPADGSYTVILDPRIHSLIEKYRNLLPEWFLQSLEKTRVVNFQKLPRFETSSY